MEPSYVVMAYKTLYMPGAWMPRAWVITSLYGRGDEETMGLSFSDKLEDGDLFLYTLLKIPEKMIREVSGPQLLSFLPSARQSSSS